MCVVCSFRKFYSWEVCANLCGPNKLLFAFFCRMPKVCGWKFESTNERKVGIVTKVFLNSQRGGGKELKLLKLFLWGKVYWKI